MKITTTSEDNNEHGSSMELKLDDIIMQRDDNVEPPVEDAIAAIRPEIVMLPDTLAKERNPALFARTFRTTKEVTYQLLSVGDLSADKKPLYFGSRKIQYKPNADNNGEFSLSYEVEWIPWNTTYRGPCRNDAGEDTWSYSSEEYRQTSTGIWLGEDPMIFLKNWEVEPPIFYQTLGKLEGHWWYHPEAFPEHPVAFGDRWSLPIASDRARGYQYEVTGYARVDKRETIVVRRIWILHHPKLNFKWTWDDTFYVSVDDHLPLYVEYNILLENAVRAIHIHLYQRRMN